MDGRTVGSGLEVKDFAVDVDCRAHDDRLVAAMEKGR